MPVCAFFTRLTSRACSSIVRFLWMKPMPPSRAMRIAVAASVTVSIADDDERDRAAGSPGSAACATSTSRGMTSLYAGHEQDVVEGERLAKLVLEHGAP